MRKNNKRPPFHNKSSPAKKQKLENIEKVENNDENEENIELEEEIEAVENLEYTGPYDKFPTESDYGIRAYIDKERGAFNAMFKQRYTDFQVREWSLDDKIVKLTDIKTLPQVDMEESVESSVVYEDKDIIEAFTGLLEPNKIQELIEYSKLNSRSPESNESLMLTGDVVTDKVKRTKVHENIRKIFKGVLDSETALIGEKHIKIFFGKGQKRKQFYWPKNKPPNLQFVLYKENIDTLRALQELGRAVGINEKMFHTAGTKDKRAVTSQLVTVTKTHAKRLLQVNDNPLLNSIKVGNFDYVNYPLTLGSLKGNHFTITLRDVKASDELLTKACEAVKEKGFINYFGAQRFGTSAIPTHFIGRSLLQAKWEEAIDLILCPRGFENGQVYNARLTYQKTGNAEEALRMFPYYCVIEKMLLRNIISHGKLLNAFSSLPKNMQLLYVHAYQSWIWNSAASKRIEMAESWEPIIGDLVYNSKTEKYEHVTQENKNNYTIYDVCLPLPGYDVLYPKNEICKYIEDLMAQDSLSPYSMTRPQKVFSLPGGYRMLVKKPVNFEYQIFHYDDHTIPLTLTDLEEIQGKSLPVSPTSGGPLTGLVIRMLLDSATYATMLIRELTKVSTTKLDQKQLEK